MLVALILPSLFIIKGAGSWAPEAYEYLGEGVDSDTLKSLPKVEKLEDCTRAHFIQNKKPCLNTAQNIFEMRFKLFGGKWLPCPAQCQEYAKTNKLRTRLTKEGLTEYYRRGHYDFFQLEDQTDKADPIVSGPNGELYCPMLPDGNSLVTTKDILLGSNPENYGCLFNFDRGICYVPKKTTQSKLQPEWERSYNEGNCGPICPVTGRPQFPSKVLLTVCYAMEERACCFPNQDTEIEEFYYDFLTAGDRCKEELIPAKRALRRIFCMACHHNAGKYIVDGEIRICKSLALQIAPEKFDKCGVLMAEERGAPWFGDDMVTPSAQWGVGLAGAIAMLEAEGGGDPQDEKLTKAAGEDPSDEQAARIGAFPPFIPEDYKIKIVDNCILDRYNPYTGETTECAEIDENITATCYAYTDTDASLTNTISLAFVFFFVAGFGF